MPELPEVETVARGLRSLKDRRLASLEIIDHKVWFESELPPEILFGRKLSEVSRRAKYILLRFEGGLTLIQHLRMTGKMLDCASSLIPEDVRGGVVSRSQKGLQVRCRFLFEQGEIWFFDTRRFGTLTLVESEEAFFLAKGIAPDPIVEPERALNWFLEKISVTAKPVKTALLDQMIVAGVGNIYADEALYAAKIHPSTPAQNIRQPELLWKEILRLLERSIRMGGTTILNYVNAEGKEGRFARLLMVYDREGEPCKVCGVSVKKIVLGGRSTHFCPNCQPRKSLKASRAKRASGSVLKLGARVLRPAVL